MVVNVDEVSFKVLLCENQQQGKWENPQWQTPLKFTNVPIFVDEDKITHAQEGVSRVRSPYLNDLSSESYDTL